MSKPTTPISQQTTTPSVATSVKSKKVYPTPKPMLTLGDIVGINYSKKPVKAKKVIKIPTRITKRIANINPTDIDNTKNYESDFQSIQSVINSCHPDIKSIFHRGNVLLWKATADHLTIKMNTGITLVVTPLQGKKKNYKLFEKKKCILDITG